MFAYLLDQISSAILLSDGITEFAVSRVLQPPLLANFIRNVLTSRVLAYVGQLKI